MRKKQKKRKDYVKTESVTFIGKHWSYKLLRTTRGQAEDKKILNHAVIFRFSFLSSAVTVQSLNL